MGRVERPAATQSASCRRPDAGGFTLIEIVIALAVVGLVTGLVIPIAGRWFPQLGRSAQLESVEEALSALPEKARRSGQTISLGNIESGAKPDESGGLIELRTGWGLLVEKPIVYRYDGFCTGGLLRVTFPEGESAYRLDPPFCRPQRL